MIHPDTELTFINAQKGYGVVATKFIPRGTITWVQDELDASFSGHEVNKMREVTRQLIDKYAFTNGTGEKVLCWDHAKYVNHSFNPNCMSTAYDFEFAVRDIEAGEELTDDYGYLNVEQPFVPLDEGLERKIVYPDDILTYHKIWDNQLINCLADILRVNQPLVFYADQEKWRDFSHSVSAGKSLRSIKECHFYAPMVNGLKESK